MTDIQLYSYFMIDFITTYFTEYDLNVFVDQALSPHHIRLNDINHKTENSASGNEKR